MKKPVKPEIQDEFTAAMHAEFWVDDETDMKPGLGYRRAL
jgi:hypothetical protein